MREYGRRSHARAGTALNDLEQTHLGEFTADWHPTRSLNPGGRRGQQPDAAADTTSLPPGRTDRGGLVADGGRASDE